MKVYMFKGDYKKLRELGYNKFNLFSNVEMWGKTKCNCSVVVCKYISVKPYGKMNEPAITNPFEIREYIKELIENNLVEIGEDE